MCGLSDRLIVDCQEPWNLCRMPCCDWSLTPQRVGVPGGAGADPSSPFRSDCTAARRRGQLQARHPELRLVFDAWRPIPVQSMVAHAVSECNRRGVDRLDPDQALKHGGQMLAVSGHHRVMILRHLSRTGYSRPDSYRHPMGLLLTWEEPSMRSVQSPNRITTGIRRITNRCLPRCPVWTTDSVAPGVTAYGFEQHPNECGISAMETSLGLEAGAARAIYAATSASPPPPSLSLLTVVTQAAATLHPSNCGGGLKCRLELIKRILSMNGCKLLQVVVPQPTDIADSTVDQPQFSHVGSCTTIRAAGHSHQDRFFNVEASRQLIQPSKHAVKDPFCFCDR